MEKTLEKGEDQIQKICNVLRKETLEPAKEEAQKIIDNAKARAEQIIKEAHKQADKLVEDARRGIEQERTIFHSSLERAGGQALEELRQAIEHKFFNEGLQKLVDETTAQPKVIAKLIDAIVKATEREGLSCDLSIVIPQAVVPDDVLALLSQDVIKQLKAGAIELGKFAGGAQVKLKEKKMTLDLTDESLIELLSRYVRKDFRKYLFK